MPENPPADLESTTQLLSRIRAGEDGARDALVARFLPILRRWAHGRLPPVGRDLVDTDDLVQTTFMRALGNLDRFRAGPGSGAFFAYLRKILLNAVRDELRRTARQGARSDRDPDLVADQGSLVEQGIGQETLRRYERGLERLSEAQQAAVILRVEFGMTFPEVAAELDIPSADAARMTVSRALARMAEEMG